MKLIDVMKKTVAPTKKKAFAAGSLLSLYAANAWAVLGAEAQALADAATGKADEVTEVTFAVGPSIIGIVGAIAIVAIIITLIKKK